MPMMMSMAAAVPGFSSFIAGSQHGVGRAWFLTVRCGCAIVTMFVMRYGCFVGRAFGSLCCVIMAICVGTIANCIGQWCS
jgi:hypothetical protein